MPAAKAASRTTKNSGAIQRGVADNRLRELVPEDVLDRRQLRIGAVLRQHVDALRPEPARGQMAGGDLRHRPGGPGGGLVDVLFGGDLAAHVLGRQHPGPVAALFEHADGRAVAAAEGDSHDEGAGESADAAEDYLAWDIGRVEEGRPHLVAVARLELRIRGRRRRGAGGRAGIRIRLSRRLIDLELGQGRQRQAEGQHRDENRAYPLGFVHSCLLPSRLRRGRQITRLALRALRSSPPSPRYLRYTNWLSAPTGRQAHFIRGGVADIFQGGAWSSSSP